MEEWGRPEWSAFLLGFAAGWQVLLGIWWVTIFLKKGAARKDEGEYYCSCGTNHHTFQEVCECVQERRRRYVVEEMNDG